MRWRLCAVAWCLATVGVPGQASASTVVVLEIRGSCTYSPGLGPSPTWQSWSCTGTATAVGTDGVMVEHPCYATGEGTDGLAAGTGTAAGACGPYAFHDCAWTHGGSTYQVSCASEGTASAGTFESTPYDTLPTTSAAFVGTMTHVEA